MLTSTACFEQTLSASLENQVVVLTTVWRLIITILLNPQVQPSNTRPDQLHASPPKETDMDDHAKTDHLVALATDIVCAYVSNNTVAATDLPGVIGAVHSALAQASGGHVAAPVVREELKPAISLKKSITPEYLICLEDGKKFKSLKRHIRTHYNLSPEEYRDKWGLPHDYPMVAPNYAEARSALAKKMGLGTRREK
jgi:predicted transcriptional regulator